MGKVRIDFLLNRIEKTIDLLEKVEFEGQKELKQLRHVLEQAKNIHQEETA